MAEFEETFDVEEATAEDYKEFIEKMRTRLGVDSLSPNLGNLPVLPIQAGNNETPTRFFDLILQTKKRSIRLRIRRDNLYAVGYQMPDSGQWYEFGLTTQTNHLITGSTFLGFGITYNEEYLLSLQLSRPQFVGAVYALSDPDHQQGIDRKRPLMILLQMICESIRFRVISDYLMNNFYHENGLPPTDRMVNLERMWGDLSRSLRSTNGNPSAFTIADNKAKIKDAAEAVAVLGIVLACVKSGALQMGVTDDGRYNGGRPLVEVYSVRILNIDDEDPGDLYGAIEGTDALSYQRIFYRYSDNTQSISPGEFALLTGPDRSMSADGSFTIDLDLMDHDSVFPPDDEVSKGQISWEVSDTTNVYDDPIYHDIPGQYGSAEVNYIVFSDAVQATVEVTLINGDDENPANVYGVLAARSSSFTNESILFHRSEAQNIDVTPGNLIPLSRSVVAVPLNSTLIVRADLWDYDIVSYNDEIAVGTADFAAQLSGTFEKPIYGKYGEISVRVTWT